MVTQMVSDGVELMGRRRRRKRRRRFGRIFAAIATGGASEIGRKAKSKRGKKARGFGRVMAAIATGGASEAVRASAKGTRRAVKAARTKAGRKKLGRVFAAISTGGASEAARRLKSRRARRIAAGVGVAPMAAAMPLTSGIAALIARRRKRRRKKAAAASAVSSVATNPATVQTPQASAETMPAPTPVDAMPVDAQPFEDDTEFVEVQEKGGGLKKLWPIAALAAVPLLLGD